MKTADFLEQFDYIIFDLDGVITSEETYWRCAALTVYEILNKEKDIDYKELENNSEDIKNLVFCNGKTISKFKEYGINSNWDLAHYTLLACMINGADSTKISKELFTNAYNFIENLAVNAPGFYNKIEEIAIQDLSMERDAIARKGEWWKYCYNTFQEWCLGNKKSKKGLMCNEMLLLPLNELHVLFSTLKEMGKHLSIATGRPESEIESLKRWDLDKYFENIITYTDCEKARIKAKTAELLCKPNPYVFLKALLCKDYSDEKIISKNFDKTRIEKTLIVGDGGADIIPAKEIGAKFMAVLTGGLGKNARPYFEKMQAEFISDNIFGLLKEE